MFGLRFRPSLHLALPFLLMFIVGVAVAQDSGSSATNINDAAAAPATQPSPAPPAAAQAASTTPMPRLLIGPGDEVQLSVYGVPDLNQKMRVSHDGSVDLPLIGPVMVAGMTAEEAQKVIAQKYESGGFLVHPQVSFTVTEYTTQGITVLGEVGRPGTYSALLARNLYDAFHAAGGLTPRAGNTITISHAGSKTAEVIHVSNDPVKIAENNVALQPGDTVVVNRAGIVYVVGEVTRPGGYVMDTDNGKLTLAEVIAMAAGPTRVANLSKVQCLRRTPKGLETQTYNLKDIMKGKKNDVALQADDIVFMPGSKGKMALDRGSSSILSMLTSLAIYRF